MFFSGSRDIVGLKRRLGTFEVAVLRSLTNNHDLKEGTASPTLTFVPLSKRNNNYEFITVVECSLGV